MSAQKDFTCDIRCTSYDAATAKRHGMTAAQIKHEAATDKVLPMDKAEARRQSRIALLQFLGLSTRSVK